jgi:hypothetical protein
MRLISEIILCTHLSLESFMEHVRQITAFDIRHNEAFAHTQHGTSVQSSLTKEVKGDRISIF